jgi:hypothetical protein
VSITITRSVFHRFLTSAGIEICPLREIFITAVLYLAPFMASL